MQGRVRLGISNGKTHLHSRMNRFFKNPPPHRGFTLIITISLMVLLAMVAVGLLSLSSITVRASSQGQAEATARANARLSLILAIGELQSLAGADTRVSARADILDETHPPVLGVWKSWEGTNHEISGNFAGRPKSPGNYQAAKEGRFLDAMAEEVVNQVRARDFLDPTDAADLTSPPSVSTNIAFGRRFALVSFRWLSPDEV